MNPSPEKPAIPAGAPVSAETREPQAQNPETILDALKKRAESAVTAEEREKFSNLADKLAKTLASKSERAVDGTKDALAEFRSGLSPDQKKMLQDAENALKSGAGKVADTAREAGAKVAEAGAKVAEAGAKVVEAVKTGDMKEVKKLAEGIIEKTNEAGQKIREYSGMAALEKVLEPLKTQGIFGIFWVLANFWKFLTGGMKWSEMLDGAQSQAAGAVAAGTATAQSAAGQIESAREDFSQLIANAKSAFAEFSEIPKNATGKKYNEAISKCRASLAALSRIREKLTPEQKEWLDQLKAKLPWDPEILLDPVAKDKWIETQVGPVAKKIADEFYSGGNLSDDQIALVRDGLKKMHFGQDTIAKLRARMENPSESTAASMSDASTFLTELMLGNTEMLGIMFRVVPFHRFAWSVAKKTVSEGMDVYEYNLSMVFNRIKGVEPPTMTFTSDSLVSKIQGMKDDPIAQDMLLMQMYRVNGLFASIAGAAVGGAYSAFYMALDNSHGGDGLKDFKNVIWKKYDKLAGEVARLEGAFSGNSKFKPELAQTIRNELDIMKKNWLVLSLAQEWENDAAKIAKLLKTPAYSALGIAEADILKNSSNVRGFLATKMSAEGVNASALSRLPGRAFGTAAGAGGDFIDHLQDAKRFQLSLMKGDAISKLKELGSSLKILTLSRHADKTLLYFKDIDSATNTLRQLGASGGNFLSELLRSLPAVSLVIGGVDLATQDARTLTTSEKWKNFGTVAATTLIPIVWPIMLLTDPDTAPRVTKEGQIENVGMGVAAFGMLTLDGILLANALRTGKLANFMLERPRDVLRTVRGAVRTGTAITRATSRILNPEWAVKLEKALVKAGRPWKVAAFIVALWIGGYAYAKSNEDYLETLEKDGYLDKTTGDITEKAKDEFAKMNLHQRKSLADSLSHAVFDKETSLPQAKSDLSEDGMYTLVVETPEDAKKWGTALNQKHSFFTEELTKLGIGVDILDRKSFDEKQAEKKSA